MIEKIDDSDKDQSFVELHKKIIQEHQLHLVLSESIARHREDVDSLIKKYILSIRTFCMLDTWYSRLSLTGIVLFIQSPIYRRQKDPFIYESPISLPLKLNVNTGINNLLKFIYSTPQTTPEQNSYWLSNYTSFMTVFLYCTVKYFGSKKMPNNIRLDYNPCDTQISFFSSSTFPALFGHAWCIEQGVAYVHAIVEIIKLQIVNLSESISINESENSNQNHESNNFSSEYDLLSDEVKEKVISSFDFYYSFINKIVTQFLHMAGIQKYLRVALSTDFWTLCNDEIIVSYEKENNTNIDRKTSCVNNDQSLPSDSSIETSKKKKLKLKTKHFFKASQIHQAPENEVDVETTVKKDVDEYQQESNQQIPKELYLVRILKYMKQFTESLLHNISRMPSIIRYFFKKVADIDKSGLLVELIFIDYLLKSAILKPKFFALIPETAVFSATQQLTNIAKFFKASIHEHLIPDEFRDLLTGKEKFENIDGESPMKLFNELNVKKIIDKLSSYDDFDGKLEGLNGFNVQSVTDVHYNSILISVNDIKFITKIISDTIDQVDCFEEITDQNEPLKFKCHVKANEKNKIKSLVAFGEKIEFKNNELMEFWFQSFRLPSIDTTIKQSKRHKKKRKVIIKKSKKIIVKKSKKIIVKKSMKKGTKEENNTEINEQESKKENNNIENKQDNKEENDNTNDQDDVKESEDSEIKFKLKYDPRAAHRPHPPPYLWRRRPLLIRSKMQAQSNNNKATNNNSVETNKNNDTNKETDKRNDTNKENKNNYTNKETNKNNDTNKETNKNNDTNKVTDNKEDNFDISNYFKATIPPLLLPIILTPEVTPYDPKDPYIKTIAHLLSYLQEIKPYSSPNSDIKLMDFLELQLKHAIQIKSAEWITRTQAIHNKLQNSGRTEKEHLITLSNIVNSGLKKSSDLLASSFKHQEYSDYITGLLTHTDLLRAQLKPISNQALLRKFFSTKQTVTQKLSQKMNSFKQINEWVKFFKDECITELNSFVDTFLSDSSSIASSGPIILPQTVKETSKSKSKNKNKLVQSNSLPAYEKENNSIEIKTVFTEDDLKTIKFNLTRQCHSDLCTNYLSFSAFKNLTNNKFSHQDELLQKNYDKILDNYLNPSNSQEFSEVLLRLFSTPKTFDSAVHKLKKGLVYGAPLEKLAQIDETLTITQEIYKFEAGENAAADDLIPLFINALIRAKIPELASLTNYIDHFLNSLAPFVKIVDHKEEYVITTFLTASNFVIHEAEKMENQ